MKKLVITLLLISATAPAFAGWGAVKTSNTPAVESTPPLIPDNGAVSYYGNIRNRGHALPYYGNNYVPRSGYAREYPPYTNQEQNLTTYTGTNYNNRTAPLSPVDRAVNAADAAAAASANVASDATRGAANVAGSVLP